MTASRRSSTSSTGEGRLEIARKIEEAREEGDLKENGGYHAAREEQGKMEARIRQLTELLHNATIGETPPDDGVVEPGMLVTVEMLRRRGDLPARQPRDRRRLRPAGLLREVRHGRRHQRQERRRQRRRYEAPNGKTIDVKIVAAKPYTG